MKRTNGTTAGSSARFAELLQQGGSAIERHQYRKAVDLLQQAIALRPEIAEAHNSLGNALQRLDQLRDAIAAYDKAIALKAHLFQAHYNRGNALQALEEFDAAVASYERAIALRPDLSQAHFNRGVALQQLNRQQSAVESFDKAIGLSPRNAAAFVKRGDAWRRLHQFGAAWADYDRAAALAPDLAEAHAKCGIALHLLNRLEAAIASYKRALALDRDYPFVLGRLLFARKSICDWRDLDEGLQLCEAGIRSSKQVALPFDALCLFDSPELHFDVAKLYCTAGPDKSRREEIPRRAPADKIRIGYYSADFHNHATMHLMAGLLEAHDRTKFELIGFSFGPDKKDEMRRRVSSAFHQFIEVATWSDGRIVQASRDIGVDIAVDLKGFTGGGRIDIFSKRCAPIQVSYLGYPGTTGSSFMDYVIADRTVIPQESLSVFTEKVVYLPNCYQVNTSRRVFDGVLTRRDVGLPDEGFVFCCFNDCYKISASTFDVWTRLLENVAGSVLWLLEDNPRAADNLRREAEARGIDGGRLVFAKRIPLDQHLARHRLADLFLDTLPYNAHTTASDALWAGLPVLTQAGQSFAARVASSVLHAVNLPQLIARDERQYQDLALDLALNPSKLSAIRQQLDVNRLSAPLFDTSLFTRHIEAAYVNMLKRHWAGLPADHMTIAG